ncbi:carbamoyl-phosphate synthase large subunit [Enterobacter cancerogenus]|uniref:ATP-grasp domain-containing protein n=1 Tax=Enterobacter cancerogenus TaxID=69218 RepID=UPI000C9CFB34|nr:carbamoyl-phosphate synthase large subunit [Enterobacter cancerogenus]
MQPMKKLNVLVFPCGSENAGEIAHSLRYSLHINRLIGASSSEDHGRLHFADYIGDVPYISAPEFDACFAKLIAHNHIDIIFATHDSVCEKLAGMDELATCYLVNGDHTATKIARRKSLTYAHFAGADWLPQVYPEGVIPDIWPVIVKPDCGQGGNCVSLAQDRTEFERLLRMIESPVVVEYLPGNELTVDCFTDRHGKIVWAGPRTRERVRAGIAMRSQFAPLEDDIAEIAENINARLALRGPWFFQIKQSRTGRWKLLEISCRVAGTMVAHRAKGINLPLMALHDYMDRDVTPLPTPHVAGIERSIKTRAVSTLECNRVYVDLDDTLIFNDWPNPVVLAFLYQSRACGKRVSLITRHVCEPLDTLIKAAISPALFDEIIHLKENEKKSLQIMGPAIFIDNHFPERVDVARLENLLVLDVDAVEFYLH